MNIDLIPTLIDQFQETFEGEVAPGVCWITSGPAESAILGTLGALTADQALTPPAPGVLPFAAHAAHLRFALDLTLERFNGGNPPGDWPSSFRLPPAAPGQSLAQRWSALRQDLRRAYAAVLAFLQQRRHTPVSELAPHPPRRPVRHDRPQRLPPGRNPADREGGGVRQLDPRCLRRSHESLYLDRPIHYLLSRQTRLAAPGERMPFRPLSFTKNLGGLHRLRDAIQAAYTPNITLAAFERAIPPSLEGRRLVIVQFFLATRILRGTEYVVEDALIRTTLAEEWSVTHARLYLFAMLLNMPGSATIPSTARPLAHKMPTFARNCTTGSVGGQTSWR